jgi:hypothetical protein
MNMPGFSAEASLGRLREEYVSNKTELGMRTEAMIVPQLRIIWESCFRVSPFYSVCGCEDEETGTSHWCVVRA